MSGQRFGSEESRSGRTVLVTDETAESDSAWPRPWALPEHTWFCGRSRQKNDAALKRLRSEGSPRISVDLVGMPDRHGVRPRITRHVLEISES